VSCVRNIWSNLYAQDKCYYKDTVAVYGTESYPDYYYLSGGLNFTLFSYDSGNNMADNITLRRFAYTQPMFSISELKNNAIIVEEEAIFNVSGFVVSCAGLENGTSITFSLTNGSAIESMITGNSGNWSFSDISPGMYRVSAEKNGSDYVPASQLVTVSNSNIINKKLSIARGYCPEYSPSEDFGNIFFDVVGGFFSGLASVSISGFIIWTVVACIFLLLAGMLLGRR
jgi:hypothetical protein